MGCFQNATKRWVDRLGGIYRNLLSGSGVETYDARAT